MRNYSTSIMPDSFSGIIFAMEGVSRSAVFLNGPTGCKFYHSAFSYNQVVRQTEFDPLNYPVEWYFGQPRVPCTFLDSSDYVYGGREKLEEGLSYLRDHIRFDLLCIVNSPGASLIGDDLNGIARRLIADKPVVTVETPGFSSDVCAGYETGAMALLDQLPLTRADHAAPLTVNLLGLSIFHRNCAGDVAELKRLLDLCGVRVHCSLCADCDLESMKKIPSAALNVVIHPEYGLETARYLQERFGTPYFVSDGPPIGFRGTEKFVRSICEMLGADSTAFTKDSEHGRARAYAFISRMNSLTGLPKGVTFAVEGTCSEAYAYTAFLTRYFGMVPDCVSVTEPGRDDFREKLTELCCTLGMGDISERDIMETRAELVFASGSTIAGLKLRNHAFTGIETAMPTLGYLDVIPKTHLGVTGALMIVEQVLNGMVYQ